MYSINTYATTTELR